jgi:hypothetical protein
MDFLMLLYAVSSPIMPPAQWVMGFLSLGIKQPEHEAGHSSPPNIDVCNALSFSTLLCTNGMLLRHRCIFTFSLPFFGLCRILFYNVFTSLCFGHELMHLVWHKVFNFKELRKEKCSEVSHKMMHNIYMCVSSSLPRLNKAFDKQMIC